MSDLDHMYDVWSEQERNAWVRFASQAGLEMAYEATADWPADARAAEYADRMVLQMRIRFRGAGGKL